MGDILLDRNENRYGPSPKCLQVLRTLDPELLFNYTRDFQAGYYSVLSKTLAGRHEVDEKQVVLGYGCEDILKQAVHHWLGKGERCFIPSASWWYYRTIADEVAGTTVEYPVEESSSGYHVDVEQLEKLHREQPAKLLLIASPNNPTGNAFPRERLEQTLDHFRDALVILDEAYFGFSDDAPEDRVALTRKYPRLLVLRTFSKLYALAGVRLGYGVVGAGLPSFLKFSARNLGYNRVSEQLALAALSDSAYYEHVRTSIAADRRTFYAAMAPFPGVKVYPSQANFLLVRFPAQVVAPLQRALIERGLIIKFFSEKAFLSCARITLGTQEENRILVSALQELLPRLLGAL